MRKGFTIIELLVASLLLGMLVTILTMVFNQSSTAWRIGIAGVADMDDIRDNIAELREEADNAIISGDNIYRLVGLWDRNGDLRRRACAGEGVATSFDTNEDKKWKPNMLNQKRSALTSRPSSAWNSNQNMFNVGLTGKAGGSAKTYTVNVKSAGPDRKFDTWDDIWSWPDDFE